MNPSYESRDAGKSSCPSLSGSTIMLEYVVQSWTTCEMSVDSSLNIHRDYVISTTNQTSFVMLCFSFALAGDCFSQKLMTHCVLCSAWPSIPPARACRLVWRLCEAEKEEELKTVWRRGENTASWEDSMIHKEETAIVPQSKNHREYKNFLIWWWRMKPMCLWFVSFWFGEWEIKHWLWTSQMRRFENMRSRQVSRWQKKLLNFSEEKRFHLGEITYTHIHHSLPEWKTVNRHPQSLLITHQIVV